MPKARSSVGHDKRQFEASVGRIARAAVVSPDPLGIRADGVTEERVEIAGSSYFRTSGLRLMARSGGKVLTPSRGLEPEDGIGGGRCRSRELVWEFTRP